MEQVCRAPPLGGITTNPGGVYPDHQQGWWLSQVAVISMPWQKERERMELLKSIFGHLEDDAVIVPPFYCDKGTQIYIGKHFYANTGLLILDTAGGRIFQRQRY